VPSRELHRHLAEYLKKTRRGEGFVVTNHGRPVGRLVPPVEGRSMTEVEEQ
jgi:prevent-host-death family protein